jgi:hypothetical protein
MIELRRTLIAAAAGSALLALIQPFAGATTVVALSDGELVRGARTIVHADVIDKHSVQLPSSGRIYTEYRFRVRELLKGEGTDTVVFREWGGDIGAVKYWIPGVNGYEPGEEVVTFLGEPDARTGIGLTYGLAQGKFRVERDAASGKARLTRKLAAVDIVPSPAPLSILAPPAAGGDGAGRSAPAAHLSVEEAERELEGFKAFVRVEVRK